MFEDNLNEVEMKLEDERLAEENNNLLDMCADRRFLELIQGPVEVKKVIREVETQYWRDRSLETIEDGYEEDCHEGGFDDFAQPWLVRGLAIPLGVLEHYANVIDASSLSDEAKRSLRKQLFPEKTDWPNEGF